MKKIPTPANVRTRAIEEMINDTFNFVFVRKIYIMQIVSTHIRFASIDPFHVDLLHFEKRLSSAQFRIPSPSFRPFHSCNRYNHE